MPHFYRAIEIQHGLQGARLVGRPIYQDVLDQVGNGVFLLDRSGRVCHLNAVADELMRAGGLFHLRQLRHPERGRPGRQSRARRRPRRELLLDELNYHRQIFLIRGANGLDTYFAMVAPLEQAMERTTIRQDYVGTRTPMAMLLVARPSYRPGSGAQRPAEPVPADPGGSAVGGGTL